MEEEEKKKKKKKKVHQYSNISCYIHAETRLTEDNDITRMT